MLGRWQTQLDEDFSARTKIPGPDRFIWPHSGDFGRPDQNPRRIKSLWQNSPRATRARVSVDITRAQYVNLHTLCIYGLTEEYTYVRKRNYVIKTNERAYAAAGSRDFS